MMALDLEHLRTWIGRTETAHDIVTPRLVAEYRATFGVHLAPVADGEAPLGLHWCLAPPIAPADALGPDGHPARGGFLPPVPLPRRMWAGGSIETVGALRVGERMERRSRIADVSVKTGRSGALCFVDVRHEVVTERGPVLSERHDIVYRDAAAATVPKPTDPGRQRRPRDVERTLETGPVLLFRYSAMTFNGHRIHYDLPYARDEEGYPGLVVHGPIQATVLFNLAAIVGSAVPRRFIYRGVSPLMAGEQVGVAAVRGSEGGIACWTETADGRVCMEGEQQG